MAMMPKRVKYRKSQKGRVKGNATRGNYVAFGEFGLQALEPRTHQRRDDRSRASGRQPPVRGGGKLYIRIFPHKSITSIPAETRMGKGKGEVEYWAAIVKPGTVIYELAGVPEDLARDAFARIAHKLPVACRFVTRRPTI